MRETDTKGQENGREISIIEVCVDATIQGLKENTKNTANKDELLKLVTAVSSEITWGQTEKIRKQKWEEK